MTVPVEAVSPDVVLLVELLRDGVPVGPGRHGLVKGRVEHSHLRHRGVELPHGLNAPEAGGVVEWCEDGGFMDLGDDVVVDGHGVLEERAAVYDSSGETCFDSEPSFLYKFCICKCKSLEAKYIS